MQRHPSSPNQDGGKEQILQRARQRLAEWEAQQELSEKFQQAKHVALSQAEHAQDEEQGCCTDCIEHDQRVRTRLAAYLAAQRDEDD